MIAEITGICSRRRPGLIVVNVNGIGFSVKVPEPLSNSVEVGQECSLYTQLLVRENDMSLVGFATVNERDLFNVLIGVSGVGPKLALSILTEMSPGEFVSAMVNQDVKALVKIPGLGKRTAQRLILEMETKVAAIAQELPSESSAIAGSEVNLEAKAMLMSLGCSEEEAEQALQTVLCDLPGDADTSDIVMAAMSALG